MQQPLIRRHFACSLLMWDLRSFAIGDLDEIVSYAEIDLELAIATSDSRFTVRYFSVRISLNVNT